MKYLRSYFISLVASSDFPFHKILRTFERTLKIESSRIKIYTSEYANMLIKYWWFTIFFKNKWLNQLNRNRTHNLARVFELRKISNSNILNCLELHPTQSMNALNLELKKSVLYSLISKQATIIFMSLTSWFQFKKGYGWTFEEKSIIWD